MDVKPKRDVRNIKNTKRQRKRPVRKWKSSEINNLINYMLENKEFEKPTQRIYYLDFIHQYGIDIPWDLIKGKVRNLRIKYGKLRDLYRSRDQGANRIRTLRLIEKRCPHFHKLEIIFGNRNNVLLNQIKNETSWETDISLSQNKTMDTGGPTSVDNSDINSFNMTEVRYGPGLTLATPPPQIKVTENYLKPNISVPLPITSSINDGLPWIASISKNSNEAVDPLRSDESTSTDNVDIMELSLDQENLKDFTTISNLQQISNLAENPIIEHGSLSEVNDNDDLEILKFHFEQDKFLRSIALKEKKFEFKMEMTRKQFELKMIKMELEKMKVEKDLQLDKMRFEIDERIQLKKLELEQKSNNCDVN